MKKITAIFLALMLCALASCGNPASEPSDAPSPESSAVSSTASVSSVASESALSQPAEESSQPAEESSVPEESSEAASSKPVNLKVRFDLSLIGDGYESLYVSEDASVRVIKKLSDGSCAMIDKDGKYIVRVGDEPFAFSSVHYSDVYRRAIVIEKKTDEGFRHQYSYAYFVEQDGTASNKYYFERENEIKGEHNLFFDGYRYVLLGFDKSETELSGAPQPTGDGGIRLLIDGTSYTASGEDFELEPVEENVPDPSSDEAWELVGGLATDFLDACRTKNYDKLREVTTYDYYRAITEFYKGAIYSTGLPDVRLILEGSTDAEIIMDKNLVLSRIMTNKGECSTICFRYTDGDVSLSHGSEDYCYVTVECMGNGSFLVCGTSNIAW